MSFFDGAAGYASAAAAATKSLTFCCSSVDKDGSAPKCSDEERRMALRMLLGKSRREAFAVRPPTRSRSAAVRYCRHHAPVASDLATNALASRHLRHLLHAAAPRESTGLIPDCCRAPPRALKFLHRAHRRTTAPAPASAKRRFIASLSHASSALSTESRQAQLRATSRLSMAHRATQITPSIFRSWAEVFRCCCRLLSHRRRRSAGIRERKARRIGSGQTDIQSHLLGALMASAASTRRRR